MSHISQSRKVPQRHDAVCSRSFRRKFVFLRYNRERTSADAEQDLLQYEDFAQTYVNYLVSCLSRQSKTLSRVFESLRTNSTGSSFGLVENSFTNTTSALPEAEQRSTSATTRRVSEISCSSTVQPLTPTFPLPLIARLLLQLSNLYSPVAMEISRWSPDLSSCKTTS